MVKKETPKEALSPREALQPYLKHLYAFVRREIRYYESLGLLPEGELHPADVVDEVVEAALSLWDARPAGSLRPWLLQLALRRLRQYLQAARSRPSPTIPLEELVPQEDWSTLQTDTEIWEFYEPDDVLAWEDILPDPTAPPPDEFLLEAELDEPLQTALASLGPRVREVFVLYALEGLKEEEIARLYGWDVEQVKQYLAMARDQLRERLGLLPKEEEMAQVERTLERGDEHGHQSGSDSH
ncbi:MAG: sigma-70 family RNA polymerase sigma factor [Chloroflexi bacterium]|nr:sigma-70 family RNA polymerase sigma factor [Chloroflexota bacterium]